MAKDKHEKVSEWHTHKNSCDKCQTVDSRQTSSLINCCLIGAPLLRDYLNKMVTPKIRAKSTALRNQFSQDADGKSHKATKAQLREVMKYK
jgi:hypothetical protein